MRNPLHGRILPRLMTLAVIASLAALASGDLRAAENTATKFYLVGVGPGDPDLITLRAVKVIRQSDVIFCFKRLGEKFPEYLEGKEVVDGYGLLFRYYGQDPSEFESDQRQECEEVTQKRNRFIAEVRRAIGQGKTVAVLDSGDPLIYGPWAWCLEEFEDLDPVVVPGVSCFNAANAALRRSITSSEETKSVILTAADWPGKTDTIDKLAVHHSTMALFTMKTEFEEFIRKLSVNYPPETPVAIVKYAGYAGKEAVIHGRLGTILQQIGDERLPFEYMIYVGDFLTYRDKKPAGAERP